MAANLISTIAFSGDDIKTIGVVAFIALLLIWQMIARDKRLEEREEKRIEELNKKHAEMEKFCRESLLENSEKSTRMLERAVESIEENSEIVKDCALVLMEVKQKL